MGKEKERGAGGGGEGGGVAGRAQSVLADEEGAMVDILRGFYKKTPEVIARVKAQLPADFSPKVRDSILAGLEAMAERLKDI